MESDRALPLIEPCLLADRLPEGTDLLFLAPGRKSLSRDGQGNQRFEVLGCGIGEACLPFPHRFAGDAKPLGQARLRQPEHGAQGMDKVTRCPLSDPDSKRVLRCSQVLERALAIIPLQVDDRLIPLRRVLEVRALCTEAQLTAECLVLASAWSQDLHDPGSPFLRLACPQGEDKSQ